MKFKPYQFALLFKILITFSCHKSDSFLDPNTENIHKAETFDFIKNSLVGADLNNFLAIEKRLDFRSQFQINIAEGETLQFIKVSETENEFDFYLAVVDINSITRIQLIRITQSDLQDAKNSISSILKSGKVRESFNVSFFLLSGKHIVTMEGVSGGLQKQSVYRKKNAKDSNGVGMSIGQSGSGCIDWFIVTTITYPDGSQYIYEEFVGTTCNSCMPDINNQSVLPENCLDGVGGTGGMTDPPLEPSDIDKSQLTTACFINVLNMLLNNPQYANDRITQILDANFNSGDLKNIIFKEKALSGTTDGTTTFTTNNVGGKTAHITLNSNLFPQASSEYVLATIIHEILHAYLNVNNIVSDPGWMDHNTISDKYIFPMTQCLQHYFPKLNKDDAEALAWGGLQETIYWKIFETKYPTIANSYLQTNRNYKYFGGPGGGYGTWCR